jgi:hypothetical protein
MTQAPYFYILSFRASMGLSYVPLSLRQALSNRLVLMMPQLVSASKTSFQSQVIDSPQYGGNTSFYATGLIAFSTMAYYFLSAVQRQMSTFGFRVSTNRTRASLVQGFNGITVDAPIQDLLQGLVYFQQHNILTSSMLVALTSDGQATPVFATLLLGTSQVSLLDSSVCASLDVPEPAALAAGQSDSGSSSAWWVGLVVGVLLLASLALLVVLVLLYRRRRRHCQQVALKSLGPVALHAVIAPPMLREPLARFSWQQLALIRGLDTGSFAHLSLVKLDG